MEVRIFTIKCEGCVTPEVARMITGDLHKSEAGKRAIIMCSPNAPQKMGLKIVCLNEADRNAIRHEIMSGKLQWAKSYFAPSHGSLAL